MSPLFILFGLAVLCALEVLSFPLTNLQHKRTFTLKQVPRSRSRHFVASAHVRKTFYKYNIPVPAELHVAANTALKASRCIGSAPTESVDDDAEYVLNVTIGAQAFALDLDTGSSDFPAQQVVGHNVYNPDRSNARRIANSSFEIQYGDNGTATGRVYLDRVTVGGITVDNQAVEAAASASQDFLEDKQNDGVLGMGFSTINDIQPVRQQTWFDNARSSLAEPLFTSSIKYRAAGSYDFGFIDTAKYSREIVYTPVDASDGMWAFSPTGFSVGNGTRQPLNTTAIADTGTSGFYLPAPAVQAYYAQVRGAKYLPKAGGYSFPCDSPLPDMHIVVSGRMVTVPGQNMNLSALPMGGCAGGLQPNPAQLPLSVFGDAFLKGLFVVFEARLGQSPRLGFAQQA